MSITVSSTTDSQADVNLAAGLEAGGTETVEESTEETAAEPKPKQPPEEPLDPDEDEDEQQDQEEQQPPQPKKKGGYLRKIEQLERERGYAARRIEELEAHLAGTRKPAGEPLAPQQAPTQKPAQDQYQSYEEYVEAITDWKLEQRELQMAQQAKAWHAQEEERKRLAGWQSRVGEYKRTAPDFDDVLLEAEHVRIPPALQQALIESESGPQLAYALAKDPQELERIANLPPLAAVRALGAFEARILANAGHENGNGKPAPKQQAAPPVSKAPPPVKAIANGSATTAAKRIDDPDISFQDYKRARERQIAARRNRG